MNSTSYTRRSLLVGRGALLVALALGGCSKTQDVAPGTRLFGRAPEITDVQIDPSAGSVVCDFTEGITEFYKAQPVGPILIGATYPQFNLRVTVRDSDPPPSGKSSDILLVSATYVVPDGSSQVRDVTIVLFDDGSQLASDNTQALAVGQSSAINEDCSVDAAGMTTCKSAVYQLLSGDAVKDDGVYSRSFGFASPPGSGSEFGNMVADCIVADAHQAPFSALNLQDTISLRIDVVDREGNLTSAKNRISFTVGPTQATCTGDPCGCCDLQNGSSATTNENGVCRGLPGFIGIEAPEGLCNQPLSS